MPNMMIMSVSVALLLGAMVQPVFAQVTPPAAPPVTIDRSQRYIVTSTRTRTAYQIDVLRVDSVIAKAPDRYRLPVIYVLDGNTLFPMVAEMVNLNASFSSTLPGVLIASIGYPADPALSRADQIKDGQARRTLDLSPPTTLGKTTPPGSGGAADFLAFLNDDLKTFLDERYAIDRGDQTLIGHSLGGLFTVYTFLNAPTSFRRYVALSPSLYWDDHAAARQAGALAAKTPRPAARLFVGVGDQETKASMGEDMISDARDFVAALERRQIPGLMMSSQVFPDENHISVLGVGLMRGLREVQAIR